MDTKKLKAILAELAEYVDTQEDLADYLGIKLSAINAKLNNCNVFKLSEVRKMREKYNLSSNDIYEIFIADA